MSNIKTFAFAPMWQTEKSLNFTHSSCGPNDSDSEIVLKSQRPYPVTIEYHFHGRLTRGVQENIYVWDW